MNIHEYQAKELLAKFGVPVPAGYAAMSVEEAVEAAKKLPGPLWVVKAQIHAGGRGKGKFKELGPDAKGGVRLARPVEEVRGPLQASGAYQSHGQARAFRIGCCRCRGTGITSPAPSRRSRNR